MDETPLQGGRITPGVVRVENTVRRPRRGNAMFVRALLDRLEGLDLEIAPSSRGGDEQGREIFTFLEGDVPDELDAGFSDATLVAAARLIRRFHDATAGSSLANGSEVVCHGDLSPCNAVFRAGVPVALIDFDNAAPGTRLDDLGYALFLWLNIGTDGPEPAEQARRIQIFCDAYGVSASPAIVAAISSAVATNIDRLAERGRRADVEWWQAQLNWVEENSPALAATRV